MPEGMRKNEPFAAPIVTPSTKPDVGHDENISKDEILARGLATPAVLDRAEDYALRMFAHGQKLAEARGLILVDTKYEMGITADQELIVIDEVHTPDSSRYWLRATYDDRLANGSEPESLDKEFVRRMIVDNGYDITSSVHPKNSSPTTFEPKPRDGTCVVLKPSPGQRSSPACRASTRSWRFSTKSARRPRLVTE